MEKEFTDLGILFQNIICDLKGSYPLWEDLIKQCGKFNSTLRLLIAGMSSFLESFQKLADFAMETKGGPRDLGSSMIKLCLRHKALENHLKSYTNSLVECLVVPLQEKMDEWKRNALQLDKEHGKECKKMQGEVKKASLETVKLQKKVNKGKADVKGKLELCTKDYNAKVSALEMAERNATLSAIAEHRSRFTFLVGCIKPIVAHETAMVGELESFKDMMTILEAQSSSGPGIVEQTFMDVVHGFHMTIERKKRSIKEEADIMGAMSRSSSSSSSSHKSGEAFLRNGCPENLHPTGPCQPPAAGHQVGRSATLPYSSRAPHDVAHQQQTPVVTMTVDDDFFFRQEFAPLERTTRTISPEEHPQVSVRPNLTADTFVPPPAVQQQQMQQQPQVQHYQQPQQQQIQQPPQQQQQQQQILQQFSRQQSFPSSTSLSSTSSTLSSSSGSKKVEKIYARPALVKRENSVVAPVFVAPPTVPDLPGIRLKQNEKKEVDISSLNQVILDLEKNAKLLEMSHHPTTSLQSLQSMQSMQCSSGYGTMTNVSSNETMQSIAELDALLESSLTDLEKCNTLPLKRFNHSRMEDTRRPVSTSDEVPNNNNSNGNNNNNNIWQLQNQQQQQQHLEHRLDTGTSDLDYLPPPPEDLLRPRSVDHSFPPPPTSFERTSSNHQNQHHQQQQQQHHHHYHQPQLLIQQKELNTALRQRFSQLHQNLDALSENHHHPQENHQPPQENLRRPSVPLRSEAVDGRSVCPVHCRDVDSEESDVPDEPQGFSALLRGVSLRKTIVNDRSAPVLKKI